jgi:hypothetical protein
VTDVKQKVRDDLQFLAIYSAIVAPAIILVALWNDALEAVPELSEAGSFSPSPHNQQHCRSSSAHASASVPLSNIREWSSEL